MQDIISKYLCLIGARLLLAVHRPRQPLQLLCTVLAGLNVGLHHTLGDVLCGRRHNTVSKLIFWSVGSKIKVL